MDFLEKLNYLMEQKHLNKSTLSKACDIPYTTIDGWYKKGYEGLKLTTLRKLSSFFGTSLDFWVTDENQNKESLSSYTPKEDLSFLISEYNLTDVQFKFVSQFLQLPNDEKDIICNFLESVFSTKETTLEDMIQKELDEYRKDLEIEASRQEKSSISDVPNAKNA